MLAPGVLAFAFPICPRMDRMRNFRLNDFTHGAFPLALHSLSSRASDPRAPRPRFGGPRRSITSRVVSMAQDVGRPNRARHQPSRLSRCGEARHHRRHELASHPQGRRLEAGPSCDAGQARQARLRRLPAQQAHVLKQSHRQSEGTASQACRFFHSYSATVAGPNHKNGEQQ
jgi:hypothetical protein